MASSGVTLQNVLELSRRAVVLDQEGKQEGAAYFYEQAASALSILLETDKNVPAALATKIKEYRDRAASLRASRKRHVHASIFVQ